MAAELAGRLAALTPAERGRVLERVRIRQGIAGTVTGVPAVPRDALLAASFAQERLWFLWRLTPSSSAYHVSWCYRLEGDLDLDALRAALDALIARHEILRTTFGDQDGRIRQTVGRPWACDLHVQDAHPDQVEGLAADAASQPFDLTTGPLLRPRIWRTAAREHVLLFAAHHIIIDEWSLLVFERELWAGYHSGRYHRPDPPERPDRNELPARPDRPALPVQYADYAAWHRDLVRRSRDADLQYWRTTLEGAADSTLATDAARPPQADFTGDRVRVRLPAGEFGWLPGVRTAAGATDFMVFLAIYCLLLARHGGELDVTVGTPVSGRSHPDLADQIGVFVNTVVLRVRIDPDESFTDLVGRVRDIVLAALAHQQIPFEEVVAALAPQRDPARNPLFQTMFSYTPAAVGRELATTARADLRVSGVELPTRTSHFDLSLDVTGVPDGYAVCFDHSTLLFTDLTVARLADSLTALVSGIGADPAAPVAALLAPRPSERRLVGSWQPAPVPLPGTGIQDLLRAQAARTPDAIAVTADGQHTTYAQFDAYTEHLAWRLHDLGVRRGDLVGVRLAPGPAAIAAAWAVWKAGAVFVPFDAELPPERLAGMIADTHPVVMITHPDAVSPVEPDPGGPDEAGPVGVPCLPVAGIDHSAPAPVRRGLPAAGPSDLAYVIHTSGSTGRPKGVMVEHRNLIGHALAQYVPRLAALGRPGPLRVVAGTSAFLSDFFIDQLVPLIAGHQLVVLTAAQRRDPQYLLELAHDRDRALQVVDCTTTQAQLLVEAGLLDAPHPPLMLGIGGESCPPDLWSAMRARPATTVVNTYGPAECAVDVTTQTVADSPFPLIGRPYGNAVVRILDGRLRPVVPGVAGELCIGGGPEGPVGRGYLGRPALTAASFVPDAEGGRGERLYRTGDRGRFRSDGRLEFLGRIDHQVKIQGQRVEPEEIEAVLRSHPDVAAAAVTVHPVGRTGRLQLAAHLVAAPGRVPDRLELRDFLTGRLPAAMLPARFLLRDDLPRSAAGKLDRGALTLTAEELRDQELDDEPPSTDTQRRVAAIWSDILGVDVTGIRQDFFVLGGHSLLASRLVLRLRQEFGVQVPLHQVFRVSTVADQARWIDRQPATTSSAIAVRPRDGDLPASYAQERLWFLWRLAPRSSAYHVAWCYEIEGRLDVAALGAALDGLIERFEVLRTTLHEDDGAVRQLIGPPWACGLQAQEPAGDVTELAAAVATQPFDPTTGPLLRVRAWRTAPQRHVLLFVAHHLVLDEWSMLVFERELWSLYRTGRQPAPDGTAGPVTELAPVNVQYADYAGWHRDLVARTETDDLTHWRGVLAGLDEDDRNGLVPDHPRSQVQAFAGGRCTTVVPAGQVGWLEGVRTRCGVTDFVILLAVYLLTLARHSGDRDIVVGTPVSGRSHPDLTGLVGFFVNTLVIRVRVDARQTFGDFLARVREVVLDAFAHQEVPFERVVREIAPHRDAARNPLFQTMFSYTPATVEAELTAGLPAGLTARGIDLPSEGSHFDLSGGFNSGSDGLRVSLDYACELFEESTVRDYLASCTGMLAALGEGYEQDDGGPDGGGDPADDGPTGRRPERVMVGTLLEPTPAERDLLASWQPVESARSRGFGRSGGSGQPVEPTASGEPEAGFVPVHFTVAEQAHSGPDAVAVEAGPIRITYAALDVAAGRLAGRLRAAGVRRGDLVGLQLPPGPAAVVAVLAVWSAGGAFLALDPDLPPARLATVLQDATAALVVAATGTSGPGRMLLTATDLAELTELTELTDLAVLAKRADVDGEPETPIAVGPRDAAYVMYTSGSTGRPKGVVVEHGGLANRAATQLLPRLAAAGGGRRLRVAAGTSSFLSDFFLDEFLPLLGGHRLVMLSADERRDPRHLVALAADPATAIDVIDCTTSQLQLLVEAGLLDAPHPPGSVSFGGEACPPDLWTQLRSHPATTCVNLYGPTETTVDVTLADVQDTPTPVIGRAYGKGIVVALLDDRQRPVPPGAVGELCVGGPVVATGYLRRPALTAAAFVPDPVGTAGRLYRTGDRARFRADGRLEFWGRADQQVKIRGQRVEPQEVEAVLRSHPDVAAAAVTVQPSSAGTGLLLIAHVVPAAGHRPDPAALTGFLSGRLPAAMVPARLQVLAQLPRTESGKLDRRALLLPEDTTPARTAPRTRTEQRIAAIWSDVLGVDEIDVRADFFALGGHSLLASRLVLRLTREFDVELPLHRVFTAPTVADQARWIDQEAPAASPIPVLADRRAVPASFAQERLWFLWQLAPTSSAYHVTWCYRLDGGLDVAALTAAVTALFTRHEILRTTFHEHDGEITQRIGSAPTFALEAEPAQLDQVTDLAAATAGQPFDLTSGPLLRVRLWRTAPDQHVLLFTAHHIVIDEWSLLVLERELWTSYRAGDEPAAPQALPVQYADYSAWHRDLVERTGDNDLSYWTDALADFSGAGIRTDHPRPQQPDFAGRSVRALVPAQRLGWLAGLRARTSATDFMVFLAVHCLLLARHSGELDVTVGTPVSGRSHPDLADQLGLFVNTVVLRVRIDPGETFTQLVARVRQIVLEAFAHQQLPFDQVVRAIAPQRDAGRNPLFQTMFSATAATVGAELAAGDRGGLSVTGLDIPTTGSHFDLSLGIEQTPTGYVVALDYASGLFDAATATGLIAAYTGLLERIDVGPDDVPGAPAERPAGLPPVVAPTDHPGQRASGVGGEVRMAELLVGEQPVAELLVAEQLVGELLAADPAERAVLAGWQGATRPVPVRPVIDLLRAQARREPATLALVSAPVRLSFGDFDAVTDALARRLVRRGVRRGDVVGLFLRPGAAAVTAVWSVWKAGAAFLPLDPDLPAARLSAVIDDARPVLVITDPAPSGGRTTDHAQLAAARPGMPLTLPLEPLSDADLDPAVLTDQDEIGSDVALPRIGPRDLAYVMFTSGSTGRPKGVMIEHGALANHAVNQLLALDDRLGRPEPTERPLRVMGVTSFGFDAFINQLVPMLAGHTQLLPTSAQRADPRSLADLAADPATAPDVLTCTTSQLALAVEAGLLWAAAPPRIVIFGGEACPPDTWSALHREGRVSAYNAYGVAECAVDSSYADVRDSPEPVIGRPNGNTRILVLDQRQQPVPPGVVGELGIGGPGVGRGYLGRRALTAAAFVPDPHGGPGARLYRTGDRGRFRLDGVLEFHGRADQQVKILGQRVELEEVETVLRRHPGVAAAALSVRAGRGQLVAHVVPRTPTIAEAGPTTAAHGAGGPQVDARSVRDFLATRLPAAMVPALVLFVAALPTTTTGKLDRGALRVPEELTADELTPADPAGRPSDRPRTAAEKRVAAVWSTVLGLREVGAHDDFFAVGGHSLLAIRLAEGLRQAFGVPVPLHLLLSATTVAAQAAQLDLPMTDAGAAATDPAIASAGTVVRLAGTAGAVPLVLVHPLGGTLFCYRELAADLGRDHEVLGVQGDLSGGSPADQGTAALIRQYADRLAPVLAGRPAVLAGWSAGAVLAHALAVELEGRGVGVQRLVLLDADPDPAPVRRRHDAAVLRRLDPQVRRRGVAALLAEPGVDRLLAMLGVERRDLSGLSAAGAGDLIGFWRDLLAALAGHQPARFTGPAQLVVSRADSSPDASALEQAWPPLVGELTVSSSDGGHFELLRRPWVTGVADAFRNPSEQSGV